MSRLRVVALLLVGCGATAPQASAPPPASTESAPNTLQLHIVSRFLTRSVIAADDSGTRFAAGPWRVEMTAEGARVSEDRTFLDIGAVNRCGEGWLIKSEGGLFAYASEFLGPMEILGTELTLAVDRHGDGAIVVGEPAADIDPFFIDCQVPTLRPLRPSAADVVDAVHDGDDILALTMDGLVYESRDRGVSWARVPLSDPAVAIDHGAESAVMLAGGGRHPWRTVDRPAYRYDPLADEIRDQVAIAAMAERPELRFTLRDARTSIATADGLLAYRAMPSAAVLFADHAGTLSIDPSPLASSNLPLGRTQVGPRCRLDRWGSKIGFWCGEVFTARREEIRPVGVLAGRHVLQPIYSTNGRHLVVDASCGPDSDLPEDLLPYCFVDAEEGVRGRSAPVTDELLTIVGSTVVFANADVLRMVPLRGPAQEFPLFHAGDRVEVISARALTNHRVLLRGQTSGEPLMSVGRVDESPRWRPVPALYFDFADLGFGVAAGENASEIWVTYDRDRWHPIAMDVASLAALGQRRVDKVVCDLDGCQVGPLFLSRPEGTPVVAEFANPNVHWPAPNRTEDAEPRVQCNPAEQRPRTAHPAATRANGVAVWREAVQGGHALAWQSLLEPSVTGRSAAIADAGQCTSLGATPDSLLAYCCADGCEIVHVAAGGTSTTLFDSTSVEAVAAAFPANDRWGLLTLSREEATVSSVARDGSHRIVRRFGAALRDYELALAERDGRFIVTARKENAVWIFPTEGEPERITLPREFAPCASSPAAPLRVRMGNHELTLSADASCVEAINSAVGRGAAWIHAQVNGGQVSGIVAYLHGGPRSLECGFPRADATR